MTGESRRLVARGALLVVLLAAFAGLASAQQRRPRVECRLERTQCYEGESIGYVVEALDVSDPEAPDLSAFTDFDVKGGGTKDFQSTVNGRTRFGRQYAYAIAPKKVGALKVPAPSVKAEGRTLVGNELALQVLAPDSQDFVRLSVDVMPKEVYPLRPVTVSLRVFVARIPGAGATQDPVALLTQLDPPPTPMLRIPWVQLPEGITAGDWNDWLLPRQLRDRRSGRTGAFAINEIASGGMPSLMLDDFFGGPRYALFDLEGRPATEQDVAAIPGLAGHADRYFVYRLDREITPTRAGVFDFGPATFKGRVIDSLQDRRVTLKDVYAVGSAARLTVMPVPEAGKPESFTGGIGAFELSATVAPTKAHVGDPITLTLAVTGHGNLEEIGPPPIASLPEIASAFKVYEASAETKGGARVFTWSLRPLAATVTEVPAIPLSWFDVEREQYVTAKSEALPLVVEEATRLDTSSIVSGGAPREAAGPELSARASGLFAHDTDPRHLGDERVHWKRHAAAAIALPLVTLAGLSAFGAWQRRHSDPRARRRRGAAARARERVKQARELARGGDAIATSDALRLALAGLVADAADLPEAGLTARETREALAALLPAAPLAPEAGAALERWESSRYAGGGVDAASVAAEGEALVERAIAELSRGGKLA